MVEFVIPNKYIWFSKILSKYGIYYHNYGMQGWRDKAVNQYVSLRTLLQVKPKLINKKESLWIDIIKPI